MGLPALDILNLGAKLIDRFVPDPAQNEANKLELLRMHQTGELAELTADTQLALGQIEVNKIEAASTRLFVAGWRPFVGWIGGAALGFKYIGGPFLFMVGQAFGHPVELPKIDATDLIPLMMALLGMGGMRTAEKIKGVA